MKKNGFLILAILILNNAVFPNCNNKPSYDITNSTYSLKIDVLRAAFLKPRISFEYFALKKISFELNASYFWTGKVIVPVYTNYTNAIGIGPANGFDGSIDANYSLAQNNYFRLYAGLGFFYKNSHFHEKIITGDNSDGGSDHPRKYTQSEKYYTKAAKFNFGFFAGTRNFYVNPYISIIWGESIVDGTVRFNGISYQNKYEPPTPNKPYHKKRTALYPEIGIRLCLGLKEKSLK